MKRLSFICIVCFMIGILGCYNRVHFTPSTNEAFTPNPIKWTEIQIFTESPTKPFVEIGFLQGEFDSGVVTPNKNIEVLKRKAYEVGADAIIKFSCNPGSGWGPGYCQGTAIRFIPTK